MECVCPRDATDGLSSPLGLNALRWYASLVSALAPKGSKGLKALGITYLDDVLMSAVGCFHARCAVRRVFNVMRSAGFLVSEKSMLHPERGEWTPPFSCKRTRTDGLMGDAIALWLIDFIRNGLDGSGAARLLGKLEWAVGRYAGLAPFLSGGSCWKLFGSCPFHVRLCHTLMTAIAFTLLP